MSFYGRDVNIAILFDAFKTAYKKFLVDPRSKSKDHLVHLEVQKEKKKEFKKELDSLADWRDKLKKKEKEEKDKYKRADI